MHTDICLRSLSVPRCEQIFGKRSLRKTASFQEQTNFRAKQRLFCLLSFKCFATGVKKFLRIASCFLRGMFPLIVLRYDFINKQIFPSSITAIKLSLVELNFKRRLIVADVRFEHQENHLDDILGYPP